MEMRRNYSSRPTVRRDWTCMCSLSFGGWVVLLFLQLLWQFGAADRSSGCPLAFCPSKRLVSRDALPRSHTAIHSITTTEVQNPTLVLGEEDTCKLKKLVEERSRARWEGNYTRADTIRERIQNISLPSGYQVLIQDIPRKSGGGSTWQLVYQHEAPATVMMEGPTVLQLAHAALGLAVAASVQTNLGRAHAALVGKEKLDLSMDAAGEIQRTEQLQSIVEQAKLRLHNTTTSVIQYELSGRKAADAAFWFALAGVADPYIFRTLVEIATRELQRFGGRPSCRAKDVYQILERFAAAGIQTRSLDGELEEVAKQCLLRKDQEISLDNTDSLLDFHSDRPLLLIWKFSTKQKKQRAFLQSALKHWERHKETTKASEDRKNPSKSVDKTEQEYDWAGMFADPSRPLVVDIGCGMGVSMLGLASSGGVDKDQVSSSQLLLGKEARITWSDCNFVGVDLGALGIGYAQGIAARWGLEGQLEFVVDSAENFLEKVQSSYPGPVSLILIQFPTPYRLKPAETPENAGNSQLPTSAQDGFMVTENLLQSVHTAISNTNGRLLLQSNCEDVSVWMRNLACDKVGFSFEDQSLLDVESVPFTSNHVAPRVPQRTAEWITMGGERANGPGWFENPLLHRAGATETEVACALNGTPVHRCLLRPK